MAAKQHALHLWLFWLLALSEYWRVVLTTMVNDGQHMDSAYGP